MKGGNSQARSTRWNRQGLPGDIIEEDGIHGGFGEKLWPIEMEKMVTPDSFRSALSEPQSSQSEPEDNTASALCRVHCVPSPRVLLVNTLLSAHSSVASSSSPVSELYPASQTQGCPEPWRYQPKPLPGPQALCATCPWRVPWALDSGWWCELPVGLALLGILVGDADSVSFQLRCYASHSQRRSQLYFPIENLFRLKSQLFPIGLRRITTSHPKCSWQDLVSA